MVFQRQRVPSSAGAVAHCSLTLSCAPTCQILKCQSQSHPQCSQQTPLHAQGLCRDSINSQTCTRVLRPLCSLCLQENI